MTAVQESPQSIIERLRQRIAEPGVEQQPDELDGRPESERIPESAWPVNQPDWEERVERARTDAVNDVLASMDEDTDWESYKKGIANDIERIWWIMRHATTVWTEGGEADLLLTYLETVNELLNAVGGEV